MSKKKKTTGGGPPPETKCCSRCKKVKNRSEFYSDPSRKTLLHCYCKKCACELNRQRMRKANYSVSVNQKRCFRCGVTKPASDFHKNKAVCTGLRTYCKKCETELGEERWKLLRGKLLEGYGSVCVCCGETRTEFLTIDHVKNNGAEERRKLRGNNGKLYRAIIERGFPKDEYQILCWNCNAARQYFGECPHERERREGQTQAVKE